MSGRRTTRCWAARRPAPDDRREAIRPGRLTPAGDRGLGSPARSRCRACRGLEGAEGEGRLRCRRNTRLPERRRSPRLDLSSGSGSPAWALVPLGHGRPSRQQAQASLERAPAPRAAEETWAGGLRTRGSARGCDRCLVCVQVGPRPALGEWLCHQRGCAAACDSRACGRGQEPDAKRAGEARRTDVVQQRKPPSLRAGGHATATEASARIDPRHSRFDAGGGGSAAKDGDGLEAKGSDRRRGDRPPGGRAEGDAGRHRIRDPRRAGCARAGRSAGG
jgi:hypothetical protein